MNKFKYVVVGAGFSGSVVAERIANKLKEKVLVIEKRKHIGGNAFDYSEDGIVIQKYGPHIFHTNNRQVWNYITRFGKFNAYKHKVLAYIKGDFVPLPFNFTTIEKLFPERQAKSMESLLTEEFGFGTRVPIINLTNSKNSLIRELAEFVYKTVFLNYTIKQWGVTPENIDRSVISRVPVNISYEDTYFTDRFQCIPKDSFTTLFEKILSNKHITVSLQTNFKDLFHIDFGSKKILMKNGKKFDGAIIYTGRADELFGFKFGRLEYRTLNFVYEEYQKEFHQKAAVVNYPNNYKFTRITEFKHFYMTKSNNTIIAKEFPGAFTEGKEPYYPVISARNKEIYERYKHLAKKFKNLTLLGRLANYRYINMDEAIFNALKNFANLYGNK